MDIFNIIKQYIHTYFFGFAKIFAMFILVFILGKSLAPEEFAVYGLLSSFIVWGTFFLGLGFNNYSMRYIPGREEAERLKIFKTLIITELIFAFSIIFMFAILNFGEIFFSKFNLSFSWRYIRIGTIILFFNLIMRECMRYFTSIKKIEVANILNFTANSLWIFFLLGIFLAGKNIVLETLIIVWILGEILAVFYAFYKIEKSFLFVKLDHGILKKAIIFSTPLFISSLCVQSNFYLDRYLLGFFTNSFTVGYYSLASSITIVGIFFIGEIVIDVSRPYMIEAHNENNLLRRNLILNKVFKYSILVTMPFILFISIFPRDTILFIAKEEYISASFLLYFLVSVPLFANLSYVLQSVLFLNNKTTKIFILNFSALILNLFLNILLIPKYGAAGSAFAAMISFIILFISTYKKIDKNEKIINWSEIRIIKILILFLTLGMILFFVKNNLPIDFAFSFLGKIKFVFLAIIYFLLYSIGLFIFKVLDNKELSFLNSLKTYFQKKY